MERAGFGPAYRPPLTAGGAAASREARRRFRVRFAFRLGASAQAAQPQTMFVNARPPPLTVLVVSRVKYLMLFVFVGEWADSEPTALVVTALLATSVFDVSYAFNVSVYWVSLPWMPTDSASRFTLVTGLVKVRRNGPCWWPMDKA